MAEGGGWQHELRSVLLGHGGWCLLALPCAGHCSLGAPGQVGPMTPFTEGTQAHRGLGACSESHS